MTQVLSVSMPDFMFKFMKDNNLSPSTLLQDAITYLDTENVTSMLKHNKEIRGARDRLIKFIQEKGLSEEFSKYVLEKKD